MDNLVEDLSDIIQAYICGCISEDKRIQTVSADALAFFVENQLVYNKDVLCETSNLDEPDELDYYA